MWCGKCQCDVVTELATDNRRVICATCGTALGEAAAPQSEPSNQRNSRAQEARELLNRWANGRSSDPFGPPRKRVFDDVLQSSPANAAHPEAVAAEAPKPVETRAAETSRNATSFFDETPSDPDQVTPPAARNSTTTSSSYVPESLTPSAELPRVNAVDLDRLTNEILARVEKISRGSEPRSSSASWTASENLPTARPAPSSTSLEAASMNATSESEKTSGSNAGTSVIAPIQRVDQPHVSTMNASGNVDQPKNSNGNDGPSNRSAMNSNQKSVEPHFNETRPEPSNQWLLTVRRKLGLMGHVAQILCYIGILGITLGFAIVIVGTFGSTGNLAPTGWLVATLGQMLLLLGVVTTVSVGMEQSASEMRGIVDDRMAEISAQIQQLKENQQRADTGRPAATGFPHTTSQSARLDEATV